MLCSTGKSGSNWLDRLRSSKGFPANSDLNLDQFLNLHNPNISDTKDNDPNPNTNSIPAQNPVLDRNQSPDISSDVGGRDLFGIMTNVLSELFVMGDTHNFPRKKGYRKNPNPKICAVSISPKVDNFPAEFAPSPSSRNNCVKENNEREEEVNGGALCSEDLSAFSRTEVTVIDTSCGDWKFEKMLYRRKNVWKVRDKKCKGMINFCRKKTKASDFSGKDAKKPKISLGQCSSLNVAGNEGLDQNDGVEEACKEGTVNLSKFCKTRLPRNSKKGSSSVILIKSIPTTKKDGRSSSKNFLKST